MPVGALPSRCARDADLRNKFAHLTNTAVNKKHPNFSDDNTRTLTWLIAKLRAEAEAAEACGAKRRRQKSTDKTKREVEEQDSDSDSDGECDSVEGSSDDSDGESEVDERNRAHGDEFEGTDAPALHFGVADVDELQQRLADACVKTLLVAQPLLAQAYRSTFPMAHAHSHCFEVLGIGLHLHRTDQLLQQISPTEKPLAPYAHLRRDVQLPL